MRTSAVALCLAPLLVVMSSPPSGAQEVESVAGCITTNPVAQCIQDAISAVVTQGGGIVFVPAGTHELDELVWIWGPGVHLMGEGAGRTTLRAKDNTTFDSFAGARGAIAIGGIIASDLADVSVTGLTLDMNHAGNANSDHDGIVVAYTVDGLRISELEVKNVPRSAVRFLDSGSSKTRDRVQVSKNVFSEVGFRGVEVVRARRIRISDNQLSNTGETAIRVASTVDAIISRNAVDRSAPPQSTFQGSAVAGDLVHIGSGVEGLVVQGNHLLGGLDELVPSGNGVGWNRQAAVKPDRVSILDNMIGKTWGLGIDVPPNAVVVGNMIRDSFGWGIRVQNPFAHTDFGSIQISSNTIINPNHNNFPEPSHVGCLGIQLSNKSAFASTIDNLLIANNICQQQLTTPQFTTGALINAEDNDQIGVLSVTGNQLVDGVAPGIYWEGLTIGALRVRNNIVPVADGYRGTVALINGVADVTVAWPAHPQAHAMISRTVSAGTPGALSAEYNPATANLMIRSTSATDLSTVAWEFVGTAD